MKNEYFENRSLLLRALLEKYSMTPGAQIFIPRQRRTAHSRLYTVFEVILNYIVLSGEKKKMTEMTERNKKKKKERIYLFCT